ncbi:hypothetical protein [Rossellomorea marisflavi]|uniref:hypothetical protein n=1 Tax=Rossellomorea marisflavi TaxID=189381 RepID=UPI000A59A7A3|nr:hypothetical protein [Rossellomorea marisflavi]MCM2587924.1 hypothetical protein [Rossellomorea marisflavi]
MQTTLIILLINLVTLMIVISKQKKGRITLTTKKTAIGLGMTVLVINVMLTWMM